jgi:hypothetical protein
MRPERHIGLYVKWLLKLSSSNKDLNGSTILTCICLSRRLFRVNLEISRAECNIEVTLGTLPATDTCIGYHVTRFEASRKVILHTRYVLLLCVSVIFFNV